MPPFDFDPDESMRIQSPRPETPEPDARQGRRNLETGVQLLDDEGAISEKVLNLDNKLIVANTNLKACWCFSARTMLKAHLCEVLHASAFLRTIARENHSVTARASSQCILNYGSSRQMGHRYQWITILGGNEGGAKGYAGRK